MGDSQDAVQVGKQAEPRPVAIPTPTVLVVDDEPLIRSVCKAVLENHGFRVLIAENGREGLRVFSEREHEIDVVLSDVSMPQMDGIEMVHRIFDVHPHANVILMTGFHPEHAVPDVLRKVCGLLSKPFQTKVLLDTIRKCLKYEQEHHPVS